MPGDAQGSLLAGFGGPYGVWELNPRQLSARPASPLALSLAPSQGFLGCLVLWEPGQPLGSRIGDKCQREGQAYLGLGTSRSGAEGNQRPDLQWPCSPKPPRVFG